MANQALFNAIADLVEEDQERYNQGSWGDLVDPVTGEEENIDPQHPRFQLCHTRACIAGHAVALTTSPFDLRRAADAVVKERRSSDGGVYFDEDSDEYKRIDEAYINRPIPYSTMMDKVMNLKFGGEYSYVSWGDAGAKLLEIDEYEGRQLFSGGWEPHEMDVPTALRLIGEGAKVDDVTNHSEEDVRQALNAGFDTVDEYQSSINTPECDSCGHEFSSWDLVELVKKGINSSLFSSYELQSLVDHARTKGLYIN